MRTHAMIMNDFSDLFCLHKIQIYLFSCNGNGTFQMENLEN